MVQNAVLYCFCFDLLSPPAILPAWPTHSHHLSRHGICQHYGHLTCRLGSLRRHLLHSFSQWCMPSRCRHCQRLFLPCRRSLHHPARQQDRSTHAVCGPARVVADSYTLRARASAFAANFGLAHAAVMTCIGASVGEAGQHATASRRKTSENRIKKGKLCCTQGHVDLYYRSDSYIHGLSTPKLFHMYAAMRAVTARGSDARHA